MIITAIVLVATIVVVATSMPGPHPDQQTVQLEPHQPAAAPAAAPAPPSLPPSDHHGNETTSSRPTQRTHRCSVVSLCVCVCCVCVCVWVGGPHEQEQQGVLLVRACGYFELRSPDQHTPRTGLPHNEWSGRRVVASFATYWCWIEERLAVWSHFLLGSEREDPPTIFC